ncbi:MAG: radical SAM protein, partial [Thermoplasmata archaeon]
MGFVFGPVNSRRLGRSLGIDILPYKTCTLDCVYCECGRTTEHTAERRQFFKYEDIVEEISHVLDKGPELNYVTFSGSGEATLNTDLGR